MTSPVRLATPRPEGGSSARRLLTRLVSRPHRGAGPGEGVPAALPRRSWDAYDVYFMALGRRR